MTQNNLLYAQSGGVTAVINATAAAVIETSIKNNQVDSVYCAKNGIIGALTEELIDTTHLNKDTITALKHTPGGAFGSCRFKLTNIEDNKAHYERLIEVFAAHSIKYFLYNGGGDSADTAYKISQISETMGYPVICIGVPKTIDNDLAITDNCPGFGSVAKYVAISTLEASLDVASMAETSTKVFILEVMGRHAGWIAAASGVIKNKESDPPHLILFPERQFDQSAFLEKVKHAVDSYGYCTIVVSEGVRNNEGKFLADAGTKDAFGHSQLGGTAPVIANIVKQHLGFKYHWAVADYLQRSARHIAAKTDVEQAIAVGKAAVEFAVSEKNAFMPVIKRISNSPYQWEIAAAELSNIANKEKFMPDDYISEDGFGITEKAKEYIIPLMNGEDFPPFHDGFPQYISLEHKMVEKKLPNYSLGS